MNTDNRIPGAFPWWARIAAVFLFGVCIGFSAVIDPQAPCILTTSLLARQRYAREWGALGKGFMCVDLVCVLTQALTSVGSALLLALAWGLWAVYKGPPLEITVNEEKEPAAD